MLQILRLARRDGDEWVRLFASVLAPFPQNQTINVEQITEGVLEDLQKKIQDACEWEGGGEKGRGVLGKDKIRPRLDGVDRTPSVCARIFFWGWGGGGAISNSMCGWCACKKLEYSSHESTIVIANVYNISNLICVLKFCKLQRSEVCVTLKCQHKTAEG